MTEQKARVKYTPRKCDSQKEFDTLMSAINHEQTLENHPYLDRLRELNKQKASHRDAETGTQCTVERNQSGTTGDRGETKDHQPNLSSVEA